MVCSWLANSWVCARRVSVTLLCDDSWPCIDASSVLSRIVVTVPIRSPRVLAARRLSASTLVRVAITTSRPSSPDSRNSSTAGSSPTESTRRPTASAVTSEQFLRAVVEQRDDAVVVHRDDALTDAVQQRFSVIGEPGDLGDLQPAGVPLDAPRQQPGRERGPAPHRSPRYISRRSPAPRKQLPHRRIRLAHRDDGQHRTVGRQDRNLADEGMCALDVEVAGPGAAVGHPASAEVDVLAHPGRVGRRPDHALGTDELDQSGTGQCDRAVDVGREVLGGERVGVPVADDRRRREVLGDRDHPLAAYVAELAGRLRHRHRGDGDQHHGDDQHLEHQELAGQASRAAPQPLISMTTTSFASERVTHVTHGNSIAEHHSERGRRMCPYVIDGADGLLDRRSCCWSPRLRPGAG